MTNDKRAEQLQAELRIRMPSAQVEVLKEALDEAERRGSRTDDFENIEKAIKTCPITYVPALLKSIIDRCRHEPIFKGWIGMQSFISRAYKKAGEAKSA